MSDAFVDVDLHDMTTDEARIKKMISEEFRNNKQIKRIIPGDNQGVTIFVLRELY